MDLNQLLFQHQLALIRFETSKSAAFKGSQFDLVRYYEKRLKRLRREMGVAVYPMLT